MEIITSLRERVDDLSAFSELGVDANALLSSARHLRDEAVVEALAVVTSLIHSATLVQTALVGVAAERSRREAGAGGLSAVRGHASPTSLIQSITGGTKAETARQLRIAQSLLETNDVKEPGIDAEGSALPAAPLRLPWHEPLGRALLEGTISSAQHDAIRRGLGEPRLCTGETEPSEPVVQVWALAAEQLLAVASSTPVEELAAQARTVRDLLDPTGAEERFAARYERRSFRTWVDADGVSHGHLVFDDEMAAWVRSITDSALRPRRGGPRFVADDERAQAAALIDDSRTNDQLAYDLIVDVLRAGALASHEDVFGARQPGVRLVTVKDQTRLRDMFGRLLAVGHVEDGGVAVPGSVIDRGLCETGFVDVTVDSCGNPLDVGREQRLFTPKQRIALAVRDGGCRWPGCTKPASYCEAHHCDHWARDKGRTDVAAGILLCRHHHLLLHNQGWWIRWKPGGEFLLIAPVGSVDRTPILLRSRSPVAWAWDPPPERAGWRVA